GLRTFGRPAHAGALHAVLDQVLARALGHAAGDRVAPRQVHVVRHEGAVALHVVDRLRERLALALVEPLALAESLAQAADHVADLAFEQEPQLVHDPASGVSRALLVIDGRDRPEVGEDVHDVEDQHDPGRSGQLAQDALLKRLRAVSQPDPLLGALRVALTELPAHLGESRVLAEHRGADSLVLWPRARRRRRVRRNDAALVVDLTDHVLRSPDVRLDRVDRANDRLLLLV